MVYSLPSGPLEEEHVLLYLLWSLMRMMMDVEPLPEAGGWTLCSLRSLPTQTFCDFTNPYPRCWAWWSSSKDWAGKMGASIKSPVWNKKHLGWAGIFPNSSEIWGWRLLRSQVLPGTRGGVYLTRHLSFACCVGFIFSVTNQMSAEWTFSGAEVAWFIKWNCNPTWSIWLLLACTNPFFMRSICPKYLYMVFFWQPFSSRPQNGINDELQLFLIVWFIFWHTRYWILSFSDFSPVSII